MSHDAHNGHGNGAFAGGPLLPATANAPSGVKVLIVLGAVVVIVQGFFVTSSSGFGRVWPSAASATIDLPSPHL